MGFIPISIDKYVKKHLKNNPTENEKCTTAHAIWQIAGEAGLLGITACLKVVAHGCG